MSLSLPRAAGLLLVAACLAGAVVVDRRLRDVSHNRRISEAATQSEAQGRALASAIEHDLEALQAQAVVAASAHDLKLMLDANADAATFRDYLANEPSWAPFRTAPVASAIFIDGQRIAHTDRTFPEGDELLPMVAGDPPGSGTALVVNRGVLTAIATARLPLTRAVVVLARPIAIAAATGAWVLSDGQRSLTSDGAWRDVSRLTALVGRETEAPLSTDEGLASATLAGAGVWVWSFSPLPPPPKAKSLNLAISSAIGLLALSLIGLGFLGRQKPRAEQEKLIADTSERIQQSEQLLAQLTVELEARRRAHVERLSER
jgi:hypothetical protein